MNMQIGLSDKNNQMVDNHSNEVFFDVPLFTFMEEKKVMSYNPASQL